MSIEAELLRRDQSLNPQPWVLRDDVASPTGRSDPVADEGLRLAGLIPAGLAYDTLALGYTGDDLTSVVYKQGATTVATLTLTYSSGKLTGIVRS